MSLRILRTLTILLTATVALSATACTSTETPKTVNDPSGLFHFRTPPAWQSLSRPGLIALYAADEPPATDEATFDTLSVGIYTASSDAPDAVGPRLVSLIETRAESRSWSDHTVGAPEEISIGGRPAFAVDVAGSDEKGREFAGRGALVRTNGKEVLLFAVSPSADWPDHAASVEKLFTEWYWHVRQDEATATAE